jgi:HlyD family secretion protein
MKRFIPRIVVGLLLTAVVGVGVRAYYGSKDAHQPKLTTARVTRGPIADTVSATGTLQAVTTVTVGTQVSGTISSLGADFNSVVKKGQVIARLDPSLFLAQLEQAKATLSKVSADVENARVQVADAERKFARAKELADRQLIPRSDFDVAQVAVETEKAQLKSAQAQLLQAQAALNQMQVNLDHTIITAPIDGIVIERSVDVGQTVAASLQSPTVFRIAADLTKMQVNASVDESDIGKVRPGQHVTFSVDAYPGEQFSGTVTQVRLQPTVVQNVTTYSVILDVPNRDLKLKPGMTANVGIETARRDDVVRVPNAALRFRPTADTFAALGQETPKSEGGAPGSNEAAVSPTRESESPNGARAAKRDDHATTIDAMFGPYVPVETSGRVWVSSNGRLRSIPMELGLSDGQTTEVVRGDLQPGSEVVTNVATGNEPTRSTTPNFMMPGGFPGGGFGGGNRQGGVGAAGARR